MPNRLARRVRTAALTVGALGSLGAAAIALPTVAGAQPQQPTKTPSIEQVQKQLGALALKNSELIEQYNQARIDVTHRRDAAAKAQAAAAKAQQKLASARDMLAQSFSATYEGGSFSATGALLTSDSGSSYLSRLDTLSMISDHNAQLVREVTAVKQQAADERDTANHLLSDARTKLTALGHERDTVQTQVDKYKNLLATLTAQQRAAFLAAQTPVAPKAAVKVAKQQLVSVKGTPAAAAKAVKFALSQVGKPYSWGSAGPYSYDCSGLTMASYASAGIHLPHSAAQQYNYGHHVSFSDLRPGDLIFLYEPIGHVEIYIGDGLAVSAPTEGEDVKVISVSEDSDYTGATRLVG